jgi:hypothetical protein
MSSINKTHIKIKERHALVSPHKPSARSLIAGPLSRGESLHKWRVHEHNNTLVSEIDM